MDIPVNFIVQNKNLKKLASVIILEHGVIDGNERGEELFQDSLLGRGIISTMRVKGGARGQTLTAILDYL